MARTARCTRIRKINILLKIYFSQFIILLFSFSFFAVFASHIASDRRATIKLSQLLVCVCVRVLQSFVSHIRIIYIQQQPKRRRARLNERRNKKNIAKI